MRLDANIKREGYLYFFYFFYFYVQHVPHAWPITYKETNSITTDTQFVTFIHQWPVGHTPSYVIIVLSYWGCIMT